MNSTVTANCARLSTAQNAYLSEYTAFDSLTLALAGRHFVALSRGLHPLGSALLFLVLRTPQRAHAQS